MKLMIGVPTGEYARRADFYDGFNAVDKPDGTLIMSVHGQSPAQSRNSIAERALENDCTHVLYIDDDMAINRDAITRILVHADKDVVTGLYLLRTFPHFPAAFDEKYEGGECKFMFLTSDKEGLVEIVNAGLGFCLIKTEVFKAMEKPWVRLGEIQKDGWCDDVGFFNRVRAAGFKIYCDLDILLGHHLTLTMWPRKINGAWQTVYRTHTGQEFMFPQQTTKEPLV